MKKIIFLFAVILFSCNNGDPDQTLTNCLAANSENFQVSSRTWPPTWAQTWAQTWAPASLNSALTDSLIVAGWSTYKPTVILVNDYIPDCLSSHSINVDILHKDNLTGWTKSILITNGWDTTKALVVIP